MGKQVDSFVDKFVAKWSSHVDVRIHVRNFVDPIEVTVIIYIDDVSNTLCKVDFKKSSEFQYRCFKRSMAGLLFGYCKKYREQRNSLL